VNDFLQIFTQLGVNSTLLIQFATVAVVFLYLSKFFFEPYLKLFDLRHKHLVEDRETANKLIEEGNKKLASYNQTLASARREARAILDKTILEAKMQEAEILNDAREAAKKIQAEAAASLEQQRIAVNKVLATDLEKYVQQAAEKIVLRKS
jgi:F-type H+-transporting ATPase subunit b